LKFDQKYKQKWPKIKVLAKNINLVENKKLAQKIAILVESKNFGRQSQRIS